MEQLFKNNHSLKFWDYFVLFLLLAVSGNPLFINSTEWIYMLVMGLLLIHVLLRRDGVVVSSKKLNFLLAALILLYVLQYIFLDAVSIPANINRLAKIYTGFLVVTMLGERFRYAYMRLMVFICTLSLIGFAANLLMGNIGGIVVGRHRSFIFYNYLVNVSGRELLLRNCGMFWEPGAFEGYINLVFLLYIKNLKEFYKSYRREFFILVAALLTTTSTTGYVVFAIILFFIILNNVKNFILKIMAVVVIVGATIWAFNTIEFLGNKMVREYEFAQKVGTDRANWSRLGTAMIAWENIKRHPWIGNGDLLESRYLGLGAEMVGGGNGFFGQINILGIPMILLYLILLYKNQPHTVYYKWVFVIIIILLLQGEDFLNYPLFWSLLFIQYPLIVTKPNWK